MMPSDPDAPLTALTIAQRLERARSDRGQHVCLLNEHASWTYEALANDAERLSAALMAAGVAVADRVAIMLNNSPAFAQAYLAVARTGAVPVPLDPGASQQTLRVILADFSPSAIVFEPATAASLAELAPIPSVRACFAPRVAESAVPDVWGLPVRDLAEALRCDVRPRRVFEADPNDLATIIYTSGTTDVPKGVMLTHRNLAALIRTGVETFGVTRDDRIGHILPLFHLYGLREMHIAFSAAATLVLSTQSAFPASLLKWFEQQRITGFPSVPGQLSLFLGRYRERLAALGSSLRYVLLGTAHTPAALLENIRAVLPQARLFKTYGLTECGRVTTGDFTPPDSPANSVGPAAPGVEITVRDAEGRVMPRGETGRIFISSEMVMKGYWQRPDDNATVLEGSCFKTRDLGYIDEAGRVFLVGRVDEMINTGGEKTAPWEIEMVLRQHPQVANAAVVAIPDEEGVLGEVPKAFVVPRDGSTLDAEEVKKHCARHLEPYKVPRKIVFLARLPETSLGKTQLRALKQMAE